MTQQTALVLGATGGIGGEVARRLQARGWHVRALHRAPQVGAGGLDWIKGDALSSVDVARAAEGASLLVHGVNPPGYRNWGGLVLPMLDNTIAAAKRHGARILLPGTVYNFGPETFPLIDEDAPQRPLTRKGHIRVEMEKRLERAAEAGEARALVVRAGDFFGPRAANNWFSQGLVKPGHPLRSITYPGRPGVGHQWAYLPDVAETMVRLVEQDLPDFARFHMNGHWDEDGTRMIDAIRRAAERSDLPVRRLPWRLLALAAPFNETLREMREMRYLWQRPVQLDNARLRATLGEEPRTPLDQAVRETLRGLGCLPDPVKAARPVQAARLADGR